MRGESGISSIGAVAVVAGLLALGAGFYGWQKTSEADRLRSELTAVRSEMDRARFEMKKHAQELAAAAKEQSALKVAAERLTAERDAVRASMETEQATGVQLRAELALAKDQISYLSARTSKEVVRGMPTRTTR